MEKKFIELVEVTAGVCSCDCPHCSGGYESRVTYYIDIEKMEEFRSNEDNSYEFGYVKSIVNEAMRGDQFGYSSKKYSFTDCLDWYLSFVSMSLPEGGVVVHKYVVELG